VLRDAINNVIEITENAAYCLVYDRPLTGAELTWRELTAWWATKERPIGSARLRARDLYRRLDKSMAGNDHKRLILNTYAELYARPDGFDLPAPVGSPAWLIQDLNSRPTQCTWQAWTCDPLSRSHLQAVAGRRLWLPSVPFSWTYGRSLWLGVARHL
jgi:hypothetical protein